MSAKTISNRSVDDLQCPADADRAFLWDDALSGFGVVAYPSGKKVYVAQFRQHGRSHRMKLGEHGRLTPKEARSAAKKVLGIVEGGKNPLLDRQQAKGVRTFGEVADDYMVQHAGKKCKPRTAAEYERLLKLHIRPALGSKRIVDVRRTDTARMHGKMADSPAAANRCLSLISGIWTWAARRDEVSFEANPAKGIERYPEKGCERYLTGEELGKLGDALRLAETVGIPWEVDEAGPNAKHMPKDQRVTIIDPYAAAALRLLILTGARLQEVLKAQWAWIDWQRNILFLPDSKTGRKPLYLSAPALAVLESLPRLQGNPYVIPGHGKRKRKGAVTTAKKDEPTARVDLKKPWRAIRRVAGLDGVRLHDLRHSFASVGAGASLGLPILGKLLGHSQPSTTARYSHLAADPMHRAAELIGGQIAAALDRKTADVIPLATAKGRTGT